MSDEIEEFCNSCIIEIRRQLPDRAYRSANELRNASLLVLRGQRNGRRYRVPATRKYYTASAPGEPPAVRTGVFRMSWQPKALQRGGDTYRSLIESRTKANGYVLGALLEDGTSHMAARPHHDAIKQKALPKIKRIYKEDYFN